VFDDAVGDAATAATAAANHAPSRAFYSGCDGVRHDRGDALLV